jgi:hypothetical protein
MECKEANMPRRYGYTNALNLGFPDAPYALGAAEDVRGARMMNALRAQELENYPQERVYTEQQRTRQLRREDIEDNLQEISIMGRLLQGVRDQATYDDALSRFQQMVPNANEALSEMPPYYDPQAVKNIVDFAMAAQQVPQQTARKIGQRLTKYKQVGDRQYQYETEWDGTQWVEIPGTTTPKYKVSAEERMAEKQLKAMGDLEQRASKDPMSVYSAGYRMDDDGSIWTDPITGRPEKLPSFEKITGKRGNIKAIKIAGEHLDDALEISALLQDESVKADLQQAVNEGLWDRVKGTWSNKVKLWMQKRGIGGDSKTFETITRMQKMASEQRKEFLGAAVTLTELESILGWMPDAGDSYDTMITKINVASREGAQSFFRWLDIFKDQANMAPYYRAFGWDRFNLPQIETLGVTAEVESPTAQEAVITPPTTNTAEAYLQKFGSR